MEPPKGCWGNKSDRPGRNNLQEAMVEAAGKVVSWMINKKVEYYITSWTDSNSIYNRLKIDEFTISFEIFFDSCKDCKNDECKQKGKDKFNYDVVGSVDIWETDTLVMNFFGSLEDWLKEIDEAIKK